MNEILYSRISSFALRGLKRATGIQQKPSHMLKCMDTPRPNAWKSGRTIIEHSTPGVL